MLRVTVARNASVDEYYIRQGQTEALVISGRTFRKHYPELKTLQPGKSVQALLNLMAWLNPRTKV